MLRHSSLFQFRHGDHTCVFYRDEELLREVLVPYIADGLRNGERCFCAQKPYVGRQLLYDLNFLGIDTESAIRRGALEIHTEDEVYFPQKHFSPNDMMEMLAESIDDASAKGFTGFRSAGELSWAVEGRNDCDKVVGYEKMVDEYFPGKRAIGLCQYNMDAFTPEMLQAVMESHRLHVSEKKPNCMHAGISIRRGAYSAEIVADKLMVDPNYYYVVQQNRPQQILGWGVAGTFDKANQQAENVMAVAATEQRASASWQNDEPHFA